LGTALLVFQYEQLKLLHLGHAFRRNRKCDFMGQISIHILSFFARLDHSYHEFFYKGLECLGPSLKQLRQQEKEFLSHSLAPE